MEKAKKKYTPTQRGKMFKPTYFFGYGSLMTAVGVNQKYLDHVYLEQDIMKAGLMGYKRGMNGYYGGRNFYGLLKRKGASCNGVVFKIHSWRDYRNLLYAEGGTAGYGKSRTYWPIDVTKLVKNWLIPVKHRVIALVCREDRTGKGAISLRYIERCWKFAQMQGDDFAKEFLRTGGMKYDKQALLRSAKIGKLKLY